MLCYFWHINRWKFERKCISPFFMKSNQLSCTSITNQLSSYNYFDIIDFYRKLLCNIKIKIKQLYFSHSYPLFILQINIHIARLAIQFLTRKSLLTQFLVSNLLKIFKIENVVKSTLQRLCFHQLWWLEAFTLVWMFQAK